MNSSVLRLKELDQHGPLDIYVLALTKCRDAFPDVGSYSLSPVPSAEV
jgi:hypothetical protein